MENIVPNLRRKGQIMILIHRHYLKDLRFAVRLTGRGGWIWYKFRNTDGITIN